jgi:enoyl-[acyl-carrier protein] reductase III
MTPASGSVTFDLRGQRALVTGASRGIGATIARHLAASGAEVVINCSRDLAGAAATREAIEAAGGRVSVIQANVGDPRDVRRLFETAASGHPRLDIVVHNAAVGSFKPVLDVRANQWDLSMNVNARALLLCAQQAVPLMAPHGGRIVAVSSLGSRRVVPSYGSIGVSKAALEALVRELAIELAPRAVSVNAVCPGLVDGTSIARHPDLAARRETGTQTTGNAVVTADAVADVVLFLCSGGARSIVGQTLVVDGGLSLPL